MNRYISENKELMQEWDWEANANLDPAKLTYGSNKKVWWKCPKCGGKWQATVYSRTGKDKTGCPYCVGKKVLVGFNDLATTDPYLAKEWHPAKNGDLKPTDVTKGNHKKVWWKCSQCGHEWKSSINSMTRKGRYGCAVCSRQQQGKTFTRLMVKRRGSLAETMPELAKEWHPTKNGDLTPQKITAGRFKPVWWLCPKCGYEWQSSPNNRKKGVGCPCCSGRVPKKGINDLATKYPDIAKDWDYERNYPLKPDDFLPGSGKKVWWKCPECGYEWQAVVRERAKGFCKCPNCSEKPKVEQLKFDFMK